MILHLIKLLAYHFVGKKYYKNELEQYGEPKVVSVKESEIIKDSDPVLITAHRGFSAVAPENTIPAFELGGQYKFHANECDIYITKDGHWVICHNGSIDHVCDGKGKIRNFTLDELRKFNITYGYNIEKYPDLKFPTLDEYLDVCKEYDIIPEIEIKMGGSNKNLPEIIDKLKEKDLLDKAIIISFDLIKLLTLKKYSPDTEYWFLSEHADNFGIKKCKKHGLVYAVSASNSDEKLKKVMDSGVKIAVWTVDRLSRMEELYKIGVRNITSNFITP